jgi:hypothetical protein
MPIRLQLQLCGVVALAMLLGACSGSSNHSSNAAATNGAPLIAGTPPTSAMQGAMYSFTPTASDQNGDALLFGIDAKPAWATFNTSTGQLMGTPTAADVGTDRGIVIWVTDGKSDTALPAFDLTVQALGQSPPTNHAPTISGTPTTSVAAGAQYSFVPSAADADNNSLTFAIAGKPSWATFSAQTGALTGTPPTAGTFSGIIISVSDGSTGAALPAFTITVTAPATNSPPTISGTPMTSVAAGTSYTFVPTAMDPDNNSLTFAIAGKPSWTSFNMQTGALTGTPPTGTTGNFSGIVISVSDGIASASLPAFAIAVTAPTSNRPPTISGTPATTAKQGTAYAFQPTAADADNDPLTFTIANLPSWAAFDTSTGRLSGTPGAANVRNYSNIVISVSDGKASTALPAFAITVASSNTPPTISGTPPTTGTVGTQYTFTPSANDADAGTTLTFSIANVPSWASFSTTNGRLQGTPTASGTFANITISVSDGQVSAQLPAFTITVSAAPNHAPTISGTPSTSVMQNTAYSFTPTASDADNDTLTFSIANMPSWAQFNTATGALAGTPTAANVGTTTGIVISVSDGKASTALAGFSVAVVATATGSTTLSWQPPTKNTDGSTLTDLAGYKIYWGTAAGNYPNSVTINNPGISSYVVDSLVAGTYFFVMTSLNSAGEESAYSNAATKIIQ